MVVVVVVEWYCFRTRVIPPSQANRSASCNGDMRLQLMRVFPVPICLGASGCFWQLQFDSFACGEGAAAVGVHRGSIVVIGGS